MDDDVSEDCTSNELWPDGNVFECRTLRIEGDGDEDRDTGDGGGCGADIARVMVGLPSTLYPEAILPTKLPALDGRILALSSSSWCWLYAFLTWNRFGFLLSSAGISGKSVAFPCLNSE